MNVAGIHDFDINRMADPVVVARSTHPIKALSEDPSPIAIAEDVHSTIV